MWRPVDVVPEHKKRAITVWVLLLLGIVAYTAWQVVDLRRKFDNPSTSLSITDDLYTFPPLKVCLRRGGGCDGRLNESTCLNSAVYSVYDPCGQEVNDVRISNQDNSCIAFDLSKLDLKGFEGGCYDEANKPSVKVAMDWYSSFDALNEGDYREAVVVLMGNGPNVEHTTVPYSRVIADPRNGTDAFIETDITISKLTRNFISGDSRTRYPVLSISTVEYLHQTDTDATSYTDDDSAYQDSTSEIDQDRSYQDTTSDTHGNGSYAVGSLYLTLTQGTFSVTEITDINPLDIGNFLANIGGFWELLLVIWGVCFVATRSESTKYKGRDFTQPIQVGKDIAGIMPRSSTQPMTSSAEECDMEPPDSTQWRGRQRAPGQRTHDIPPVGSEQGRDVHVSSFRAPIQQDYPRRSRSISMSSA